MIISILTGLLAGILVIWLADRLPAERALLQPTECPCCGGELPRSAGRKTLVLLGLLRCDAAGSRVRIRSVLTMGLAAAGFAFLWVRLGPGMEMPVYALFWSIFLLICVIDIEHRLILNVVIFPAMLLAIAGSLLTSRPGILLSLLGGVLGFLLVYGIYLLGAVFARVMGRLRRQQITEVAFGGGDVKLAGFIGLVTGFPDVIFALIIGMLVGGIAAILFMLWQLGIRRRYVAFTPMPYGPFLSFGGVVMMIYGPDILRWYLGA